MTEESVVAEDDCGCFCCCCLCFLEELGRKFERGGGEGRIEAEEALGLALSHSSTERASPEATLTSEYIAMMQAATTTKTGN